MQRIDYIDDIEKAFKTHKVVALLGPRQCGKTTLANDYIRNKGSDFSEVHYFDLERNTDLARLAHP
jgi:predicted AAA+ superfamily ATPase